MPVIELYHQNVHIHEEFEPHTFGYRADLYLLCVTVGESQIQSCNGQDQHSDSLLSTVLHAPL